MHFRDIKIWIIGYSSIFRRNSNVAGQKRCTCMGLHRFPRCHIRAPPPFNASSCLILNLVHSVELLLIVKVQVYCKGCVKFVTELMVVSGNLWTGGGPHFRMWLDEDAYSGPPFLPMSDLWMCGMTPPPAMVALIKLSSSSSPRMASCRWRGVIRLTFKSFDALPANSRTWRETRREI